MQFLLIAYDDTDKNALERRLNVRQSHLQYCDVLKQNGNMIFGVAILDKNEKMIGSMVVYDFLTKTELDKCLSNEPYIINKVWQKIEIKPCKIGPSFVKDFKLCSS